MLFLLICNYFPSLYANFHYLNVTDPEEPELNRDSAIDSGDAEEMTENETDLNETLNSTLDSTLNDTIDEEPGEGSDSDGRFQFC